MTSPLTDAMADMLGQIAQSGVLGEAYQAATLALLARYDGERGNAKQGGAFLRSWWTDHAYCVRSLAQMSSRERYQTARDYIAYLKTYGATDLNPEKLMCDWETEICRLATAPTVRGGDTQKEATEQSTYPTSQCSQSDYRPI